MSFEEKFMFYGMGIFGWFLGGWIGSLGTDSSFNYWWAVASSVVAAFMGVAKAEENKQKENKQKLIDEALKFYAENKNK
jgi:hypothetical protein